MTGPGAEGSVSIETLKRIKEAEVAADAGLAQLRSEGEALLKRLRNEAAEAILQVRSAGEVARQGAVANAKGAADAEAAKLLAEGRKAAQLIEMKATQTVNAKRAKVLSVVLGGFRDDEA